MTRILTIIALLFATPAAAFEVRATCISASGNSLYFLNLSPNGGTVGYRFMGQEVDYKVEQLMRDEANVYGLAEFDKAVTGETKGRPFLFRYNSDENIFRELNVTAFCKATQ